MSTSSSSTSISTALETSLFLNPTNPIFSTININLLRLETRLRDENPYRQLVQDSLIEIKSGLSLQTDLEIIFFVIFYTHKFLIKELPSKNKEHAQFLIHAHDFYVMCQGMYRYKCENPQTILEMKSIRAQSTQELLLLFKKLNQQFPLSLELRKLFTLFEYLMNDAFFQNKDQLEFLFISEKRLTNSTASDSSIPFLIREINSIFAFQEIFFYAVHQNKSNYRTLIRQATKDVQKHDAGYMKFLKTINANLTDALSSKEKGKALLDRCCQVVQASIRVRRKHLIPMYDIPTYWPLYARVVCQNSITSDIEAFAEKAISYSKKISLRRFFKHMKILELDHTPHFPRTECLELSPLNQLKKQLSDLETLLLPLLEEYKKLLPLYEKSNKEFLEEYDVSKENKLYKIQSFERTFISIQQRTQDILSEISHAAPFIKSRFLETLQTSSLTKDEAKTLPSEIETQLKNFGLYLYPLIDVLALTGGRFPLENRPEYLFPKKITRLWELTIIDYTQYVPETPSIAGPSKGEDTPVPELLNEGISQPSSSQDLPVISLEPSPPQEVEDPQALPAEEASPSPQIKPKKLTWIDVLDEFFGEEIEHIRSPEELIALILTQDFVLIRQEGTSHGLYRHTPTGTTVLISYHKDDVKRKTLNNINKSFCQAVLAIRQKELDSILEQEKTALSEQVGGRTKHKRELAAQRAEALRAQAKPLEDDIAALKFKI